MNISNKSTCPDDTSPATESAIIPFKDIGTEDRVVFYSRCRTLTASAHALISTMLSCRPRHYILVATYMDADECDIHKIKSELNMMLADAHDHIFDVLAIPSLDRISRNPVELIRIVSELRALGIRIALTRDAPKSSRRLVSILHRKASA